MGSAIGATVPSYPRASSIATLRGPYLNVDDREGAILAEARVTGCLDTSRSRVDSFDGEVLAVAPNGRATPFAAIRGRIETTLHAKAVGWRRCRVLSGEYYDRACGDRLEILRNPFSGIEVRPDHISAAVLEDEIDASTDMTWAEHAGQFNARDCAMLSFGNRNSRAALSGLSIRNVMGALSDLQNPAVATVPLQGTWTFVTGWLPWLAMGNTPGQCVFSCMYVGDH